MEMRKIARRFDEVVKVINEMREKDEQLRKFMADLQENSWKWPRSSWKRRKKIAKLEMEKLKRDTVLENL